GTSGAVGAPRSAPSTSPTNSVWSPAPCSAAGRHSSQPSAPSSSGAPAAPSLVAMPCQSAIGGTPRAKCCATSSWPAASRLSAKLSARRSSSCIAAWRLTATPTSGGSSERETREPTVKPSRSPSTSTVRTATPAGKRRSSARSSSALLVGQLLGEQAAGEPAPGELGVVEKRFERFSEARQIRGFRLKTQKALGELCAPSRRVELVGQRGDGPAVEVERAVGGTTGGEPEHGATAR